MQSISPYHLRPGDNRRLNQLSRLSEATGVPLVATGDVRYAEAPAYKRYDLLSCIREGHTVFESGRGRPINAEAYVKPEKTLRRLIPIAEAFERASAIAEACDVDLLPGEVLLPPARLPDDYGA